MYRHYSVQCPEKWQTSNTSRWLLWTAVRFLKVMWNKTIMKNESRFNLHLWFGFCLFKDRERWILFHYSKQAVDLSKCFMTFQHIIVLLLIGGKCSGGYFLFFLFLVFLSFLGWCWWWGWGGGVGGWVGGFVSNTRTDTIRNSDLSITIDGTDHSFLRPMLLCKWYQSGSVMQNKYEYEEAEVGWFLICNVQSTAKVISWGNRSHQIPS